MINKNKFINKFISFNIFNIFSLNYFFSKSQNFFNTLFIEFYLKNKTKKFNRMTKNRHFILNFFNKVNHSYLEFFFFRTFYLGEIIKPTPYSLKIKKYKGIIKKSSLKIKKRSTKIQTNFFRYFKSNNFLLEKFDKENCGKKKISKNIEKNKKKEYETLLEDLEIDLRYKMKKIKKKKEKLGNTEYKKKLIEKIEKHQKEYDKLKNEEIENVLLLVHLIKMIIMNKP
jgi:hypothetical protein